MKRYITIDFLRGVAIFGVVFVHLFEDSFNANFSMNNTPLSVILILILVMYFGCFGGFFVMISATGYTISFHQNLERGKSVGQVMQKQIVGGFILLFFAMAVEGVFQYYGFLGTLINTPVDPSRALWHAYAMSPPVDLAGCMIINGLIQGAMSRKKGHLKVNRNILIYAILALLVIIFTQPIWDAIKNYMASIGVSGYPYAKQPLALPNQPDYKVFMPPPGASVLAYIGYLGLDFLAGSNSPLFPFLAISFVGQIIGLLLVKKNSSPSVPKKGMFVGLGIIISGFVVWFIAGHSFSSLLPISDFADITTIGNGLNLQWMPWFLFTFGGMVIVVFLFLRLVEYRGIGKDFAKHTVFFRRFGVVPFSMYAWQRFIAMVPFLLLSLIPGVYIPLDGGSFTLLQTILILIPTIAFIYLFMILWEKISYIGGIEWMMGEVSVVLQPKGMRPKRSLANEMDSEATGKDGKKKKVHWWDYGRANAKAMLFDMECLNKVEKSEIPHETSKESKLAFKLAFLPFPLPLVGLFIARGAAKTEGKNKFYKAALILSILNMVITVAIFVVLSFLNLGMLGISL